MHYIGSLPLQWADYVNVKLYLAQNITVHSRGLERQYQGDNSSLENDQHWFPLENLQHESQRRKEKLKEKLWQGSAVMKECWRSGCLFPSVKRTTPNVCRLFLISFTAGIDTLAPPWQPFSPVMFPTRLLLLLLPLNPLTWAFSLQGWPTGTFVTVRTYVDGSGTGPRSRQLLQVRQGTELVCCTSKILLTQVQHETVTCMCKTQQIKHLTSVDWYETRQMS